MFARTTFVTARPAGIDEGLRCVREVLPTLQDVPGFVGLSTLVDRATGRCIITTSWQSMEALRDSDAQVRPIRDQCIGAFNAADTTSAAGAEGAVVDQWDVALMRRAHMSERAACARVSWLEGDPDTMSDMIDGFRTAIPSLQLLEGFASTSLLVDRMGGRAVATVVYDSSAALAKARPQENAIRTSIADATGTYVIEVAEFELAVSRLRVPELV